MSKHTPGPWVLSKEASVFHVGFNHGAGLCEVALVEAVETLEGRVMISPEQAEANARLIAAAPELLKALEHIQAMAGNPDASEGCRLIIKRARQAVAGVAESLKGNLESCPHSFGVPVDPSKCADCAKAEGRES